MEKNITKYKYLKIKTKYWASKERNMMWNIKDYGKNYFLKKILFKNISK